MNKEKLKSLILLKKSFLCIGLDPNLDFIPKHLLKEESSSFCQKEKHKILYEGNKGPKKETIDTLLAYASSVQGIKVNTEKILISSN